MKIFLYSFILFAFFSTSIAQTTNQNNKYQKETKELWRKLADSGRYNDAINVLLDSIKTSKQKDKHRNYWHVGQLYACIDELYTVNNNVQKLANKDVQKTANKDVCFFQNQK